MAGWDEEPTVGREDTLIDRGRGTLQAPAAKSSPAVTSSAVSKSQAVDRGPAVARCSAVAKSPAVARYSVVPKGPVVAKSPAAGSMCPAVCSSWLSAADCMYVSDKNAYGQVRKRTFPIELVIQVTVVGRNK